MDLEGISFEKAWRHRVRSHYGDAPINIIGYEELLQAKQNANRPQDQIDLIYLKANRPRKRKKG